MECAWGLGEGAVGVDGRDDRVVRGWLAGRRGSGGFLAGWEVDGQREGVLGV